MVVIDAQVVAVSLEVAPEAEVLAVVVLVEASAAAVLAAAARQEAGKLILLLIPTRKIQYLMHKEYALTIGFSLIT